MISISAFEGMSLVTKIFKFSKLFSVLVSVIFVISQRGLLVRSLLGLFTHLILSKDAYLIVQHSFNLNLLHKLLVSSSLAAFLSEDSQGLISCLSPLFNIFYYYSGYSFPILLLLRYSFLFHNPLSVFHASQDAAYHPYCIR